MRRASRGAADRDGLNVSTLPHRPARRARRHRARHSGGGGAAPRVSRRAHRLARQREAPRDPRSRAGRSIAGWSSTIAAASAGGATLLAAVRELRRDRYDVGDRSAGADQVGRSSPGCPARRASIGFARGILRERLARLFYTDVHDPGGGGIYATERDAACRRTSISGCSQPLGVDGACREFPIDARRLGGRAADAQARPAAATRCSTPARRGRTSAGRRRGSRSLASTLRERHG